MDQDKCGVSVRLALRKDNSLILTQWDLAFALCVVSVGQDVCAT